MKTRQTLYAARSTVAHPFGDAFGGALADEVLGGHGHVVEEDRAQAAICLNEQRDFSFYYLRISSRTKDIIAGRS